MSEEVFRIGFSGHQQLGDETTIAFVSQSLRELLTAYREQTLQQNREMLVYSALAPGADQVFIKVALELNIAVEAVIPCAQYEEIFTSVEARSEYHHLLARCQSIRQLPTPECVNEAYLAAGHWIVDHCEVLILVWNGYPAGGRGGTADVASYARALRRPFVHIHTRQYTIKQYGSLQTSPEIAYGVPRRSQANTKQTIYKGEVLTVSQYKWQTPGQEDIVVRDIVERPESVLVLPIGQKENVLLIEEYDLGAETKQLTLPGGKVDDPTTEGILRRAVSELREETGFRPGKLEKLLSFYGHPGYMAHKVHLFVASELDWDPLDIENGEEICVQTLTLEEALAETKIDYRCDPEAALALWLYAGNISRIHS